MEECKKRIAWIDIAKFVGIFAIVLGHTLREGSLKQYLYSFHVALFFVISGVLFNTSGKTFFTFAKKRFFTIMVPYFVFAFISFGLFVFFGSFVDSILKTGTKNIGFNETLFEIVVMGRVSSNRPLWFLPCYFLLSLLAFPIVHVVEETKNNKIKYVSILSAIVFSVIFLLLDNNYFNTDNLPWKLACAINMLSFFLLGYCCKKLFQKLQKLKNVWRIFIALILLIIGCLLGMQNKTIAYMSNDYGNAMIFYMSSLATIGGICLICLKLSVPRFITYIGERTLPILLMHKFPILFFQTIFPYTKMLLLKNDPIMGLFVTAISIALCLLAEWIISRFFPAMIGGVRVEKKLKNEM